MNPSEKAQVLVLDIGTIPYKDAWDFQTRLHKQLVENKRAGYLHKPIHYFILCEHPPVYTLGKSGSEEHLKLDSEGLAEHQVEYFKINRGGDITFHGPGQIVGYPILDLDLIFTDVHRYVRSLEEVIIRVLKRYQIDGHRHDKYTGVWIGQQQDARQNFQEKICAIGVHLSRWVTMHGFAFNINTNLDYFNHIVPCGIQEPDKSVCSLNAVLGKNVDLQQVKDQIVEEFGLVFDVPVVKADRATVSSLIDSQTVML